MEHTTYIKVKYYETDQMGVVHHSNYIRYFETAREEMMSYYGVPYEETEARGIIMPVHEVTCEYLLPAKYNETLSVVTRLKTMPRSRITFHYTILNPAGDIVAKGYVTLAFVDKSRGVPVRAPRFLTEVLEKYIDL